MNHSHLSLADQIHHYAAYLQEQERAPATIQKYIHNLTTLADWLNGAPVTKAALLRWKETLTAQYAPSSANGAIAAVNGFLKFLGRTGLCLRPLHVQKTFFLREDRELTRSEYARLVVAAQRMGNERLSLVLQTICATGIRVSELRCVTVETVQTGRVQVCNKGKRRIVFLPEKLRRLLKKYLQKQKKASGPVFTTRTGRPLDRSNIWRDMKALCQSAGVEQGKVFPHNLRHLFARTFYTAEKDLSRLADILGHSNVNTTRIYTAESGATHARLIGRLGLVLTT